MWIAALDGAWRVLVAGLVLGAGLPILFALGVKSLAWPTATSPGRRATRPEGWSPPGCSPWW